MRNSTRRNIFVNSAAIRAGVPACAFCSPTCRQMTGKLRALADAGGDEGREGVNRTERDELVHAVNAFAASNGTFA